MTSSNRISPCRREERGVVLVWAAISVLMIAGVIMAATEDVKAVDAMTRAEFSADGQAAEIAHAGIVDGFAWMRRQTTQPVSDFAPTNDPGAAVPINDTEDPSVGLVRTFEISPGLWGRYVVRKGTAAEAYTDSNANGHFDSGEPFSDTDNDGRWTPGKHTRDVATERGMAVSGGVWYIESEGIVYRRPRAELALGDGENTVVGRTKMATEVRRMTINPPASAAICVADADNCDLGNRARVRAEGGTAVAYAQGSGTASTGGAEVDGNLSGVPGYDGSAESIFGMKWSELRSMADVSTSDPVNGLPDKVADYSMVVITGDVTYDSTRPLRGTGVVIVQGNCTIAEGSNSFFKGLLYVAGDLTARAPAILSGQVVVEGQLDARGTSGDFVEFEHDGGIVTQLLTRMGQYRYSKSPFIPSPTLADGRPTEMHKSQRRLGTGYADAMGSQGSDPAGGSGGGSGGEGSGGSGGEEAGGGGEEATEPEPAPLFDTDPVVDAIEAYLNANPTGAGNAELLTAVTKLNQAKSFLAQDPPQMIDALQKVKQGMNKLLQAIELDVPIEAFVQELDGGDGSPTLMPQIKTMVEGVIASSPAPQSALDAAAQKAVEAQDKVERARDRLTAGNDSGAMSDYRAAANKFKQSLEALDA